MTLGQWVLVVWLLPLAVIGVWFIGLILIAPWLPFYELWRDRKPVSSRRLEDAAPKEGG